MTPVFGKNQHEELEILLASLVETGLSAEQKTRLGELLRDNVEAQRFYKRYLEVHAMLEWESGAAAAHDDEQDTMQDLLQMERGVQAEAVTLIGELPGHHAADPGSLSAHDFAVVGSYVLRKAITSRAAIVTSTAAAAAAVLLLALVLINPFASDTADPIAEQLWDDNTAPIPVEHATVVATLTAEHNAQWSTPVGTLGPKAGDALTSGQHLTLIAGFAKITTNYGAIAILEAPASIEFTDEDNAIRLHAGKLVGKVSSDAKRASGFTVVTPAARIVDIGTAFGVTHDAQGTRTRVIEGETDVSPADTDELVQPTRLVAGECAAVATGSGILTRVADLTDRYASHWSAVAHPPRVEGQARFEPFMPTDLLPGAYENDQVVVFQEHAALRLPVEVPVSMRQALPADLAGGQTDALPDGAVVDCYLVHLDLPGSARVSRRKVTLYFDRPILGVVGSSDEIFASSRIFDRAGVRYREKAEGRLSDWVHAIELPGDPRAGDNADKITISEDRRRIDIELVSGPMLDRFRILVESQEN